jgi:hypothetical protein
MASEKYRSPPVEHRFKNGQSGNSEGRPLSGAGRDRTALTAVQMIAAVTPACHTGGSQYGYGYGDNTENDE